jgi:hypothetical protein
VTSGCIFGQPQDQTNIPRTGATSRNAPISGSIRGHSRRVEPTASPATSAMTKHGRPHGPPQAVDDNNRVALEIDATPEKSAVPQKRKSRGATARDLARYAEE